MDNLNFQIRYGIFSDAVDSIFELNIVFMVITIGEKKSRYKMVKLRNDYHLCGGYGRVDGNNCG